VNMWFKLLGVIFFFSLAITGCTSGGAKRVAYETLENARMQQCQEEFSANCAGREKYEDYQRKRNEVVR